MLFRSFEAHGAKEQAAPRRVFVPQEALSQVDGASVVWVVNDGVVKRVSVDVGPARGDRIEVRQGLLGGESLVLSAPAGLKDGGKVKVSGR